MFDGVRSKVLPVLTPEYVADEIMTGILTDQPIVLITRVLYSFLSLKTMMPIKSWDTLFSFLGGNQAMNQFRGRQGGVSSSKLPAKKSSRANNNVQFNLNPIANGS